MSHKYTIAGVNVEFPVKAYPCQISIMERVIGAVRNKENALLERSIIRNISFRSKF